MSYDTKSNALWNQHQALREKMDAELQRVAEEEFKPGAKVKWIYTFKRSHEPVYRHGVVVKVHAFCNVECRIGSNAATHDVRSHSLQFDV